MSESSTQRRTTAPPADPADSGNGGDKPPFEMTQVHWISAAVIAIAILFLLPIEYFIRFVVLALIVVVGMSVYAWMQGGDTTSSDSNDSATASASPKKKRSLIETWSRRFAIFTYARSKKMKKKANQGPGFLQNYGPGIVFGLVVFGLLYVFVFPVVAEATAESRAVIGSFLGSNKLYLATAMIGALMIFLPMLTKDMSYKGKDTTNRLVRLGCVLTLLLIWAAPAVRFAKGISNGETEFSLAALTGENQEESMEPQPSQQLTSSPAETQAYEAAAPDNSAAWSDWKWVQEDPKILDAIFQESDQGVLSFWSYHHNYRGDTTDFSPERYLELRQAYRNRFGITNRSQEELWQVQSALLMPNGENPYKIGFSLDGVTLSGEYQNYFRDIINSVRR